MVDPVAVRAALLREQLPGLTLRPGMVVVARVVDRQAGKGSLALAGAVLAAELPDNVGAGDRLRLQVRESGSERVVLQIVSDPALAAVPLPVPGDPRVYVDDEEAEEATRHNGEGESIALVYETPRLGALGLRLELHEGMTRAVIRARAGEPFELARRAAVLLEGALAQATGRQAQVRVEARRDPLDVYA
jgi:hypothetical protein